jgi:hypothetical protein
MVTASPTDLNHRPTYKIKTPAIFGTFISVPIFSSFHRHPKANSDGPRIISGKQLSRPMTGKARAGISQYGPLREATQKLGRNLCRRKPNKDAHAPYRWLSNPGERDHFRAFSPISTRRRSMNFAQKVNSSRLQGFPSSE